jgi:hypothetical protein
MRDSFVGFVILIVLGCFCSAAAQKCLAYGPEVSLNGTLTSKVFPGPPNYESIRSGDQKETVLLLRLSGNICTSGNDPEGVDVAETGVREVQIAVTNDRNWPAVRRLIGKKVKVSGKLFHASTGHHRTKILLDLSHISAAA